MRDPAPAASTSWMVKADRTSTAPTGVAFRGFGQVDAIPDGWARLGAGPFRHPATVPAMAWTR